MKLLLLLILLFTIFSCTEDKPNMDLEGVWIYRGNISQKDYTDTINFEYFTNEVFFNFKSNDKLIVKRYGLVDTIFKWSITNDSIISFDSVNYQIKTLSDSSLTLLNFKYSDTLLLMFVRPKNYKINLSVKEIEHILVSNAWKKTTPNNRYWESNLNFFNNYEMYYIYKNFNNKNQDTIYSYDVMTWGIEKFDDYTFLYRYEKGFRNKLKQISSISNKSISFIDNNFKREKIKYIAKIQKDNRDSTRKLLIGKWISENSRSNLYGMDTTRIRRNNRYEFIFEGNLNLEIDKEKFTYYIEGLQKEEYLWRLSKDSKTILLKRKKAKGFNHIFSPYYILDLTENKFKIRLLPFYRIGKYKAKILLLNDIQNFRKIKP